MVLCASPTDSNRASRTSAKCFKVFQGEACPSVSR